MKLISQIVNPYLPGFLARLFPAANNILRENRKGLHSDVIIVGSKLVIKLLGGKRREYSNPEEALRLGKLIHEYFMRLKALSPQLVPEFLESAIVTPEPHDPAVVSLVVLAPYSGMDLEEAIRTRRMKARRAMESVLDLLVPLVATGFPNGKTVVGIDTKPANFCLGEDNRPTFVDFVPPRFRQNDRTYLVDYPQPTGDALRHGTWKYYTPEGILANLLAQFCRVVPGTWRELTDTLVTWCRDHGYDLLARSFVERNEKLLETTTLKDETNPLMLRLAGCKLASQQKAFRPQLSEYFSHITRYETGPIEPLLLNAKTYIRTFLERTRTHTGPISRTESRAARTVAFVTSQAVIDLDSYRVFRDYVCYDKELSSLLRSLKNRIARMLTPSGLSRPANFIVCAPPGAGKTFMVEQLAKSFRDVEYVYSNSSQCATIHEVVRQHMQDVGSALNRKKCVIACLDEVDCVFSGEHLYKLLLQPMNGKPFSINGPKKKTLSFRNVVWFFLASTGVTCNDFLKINMNAPKVNDFYSRVPRENRLDLPYDADAPEEAIIRGISIMFRKARELHRHLESVEAMVLGFLGVNRFADVREIETLVEESLMRMTPRELIVCWTHLAAPESKKADLWSDFKNRNAAMATQIVDIRPAR